MVKNIFDIIRLDTWASADFFPGESKIFQEGGKNILFAYKPPKTYYFPQKSPKNIQGPPHVLPCGRLGH